MKKNNNRRLLCWLLAPLIGGCSTAMLPPAPKVVAGLLATPTERFEPPDVTPSRPTNPAGPAEPASKRGNPSSYKVFGKRYSVKRTSAGYRKRGHASWYGSKFHGRLTSSGEVYDMHQITAAHKSLPIPTYARVTRVDNGASIVVRINDRGPFVGDRLIDLSLGAAKRLKMVNAGMAVVDVEALTPYQSLDKKAPAKTAIVAKPKTPASVPRGTAGSAMIAAIKPAGNRPRAPLSQAPQTTLEQPVAQASLVASNAPDLPTKPAAAGAAENAGFTKSRKRNSLPPVADQPQSKIAARNRASVRRAYLQVAAFSVHANAERLSQQIQRQLNQETAVHSATTGIHRVRIGPVANHPDTIDPLKLRLAELGFADSYLIYTH